MSSSDQSSRRRQPNQRRPSTIAELSERALDNLYDESKPLKHFLRIAEKYRKDAREYYSKGDLENAFIHFARAATLVLDKLPAHREYYTLLTPTQRSNLNLNGSDILEELGNLKRKLSKRYEEWLRDHPGAEQPDPSALFSVPEQYNDIDLSLRRTRSKGKEREKGRQGQNRRIHEDYAIWQHDDYDVDDVDQLGERERRRSREQGSNRDRGVFVTPQQDSPSTRQVKKEAVSTARQAASVPQRTQTPDYAFTRPPLRSQNGQSYVSGAPGGPEVNDDRRRYAEVERQYHYEQQQKAMRHREEEITRRKEESRRRKEEEEGILRRQSEAEEAARAARSDHQTTLDNSGHRGSVLSAQDSFSSIASGSSMASVASSTLFPPPSATSSTVTTPSSFYQNPAASASAVAQKSPPSSYPQGSSSTQTTPPSIPYYTSGSATAQARPSPSPFSYGPGHSSAPARISPSSSSSQYAPGSSSSQVIPPSSSYYAHGSSSTQVIMPPSSSAFYPPPSSSSQAPAAQPSNRNPGSSLTTVVYANPSRGSNPLPAPPAISWSSSGSSRQEPSLQAPPAQRPDQLSSFVEGQSGPTMLPIEPERFEADFTDSESVQSFNTYRDDRQHPYSSRPIDRNDENRTPTRHRTRSPSPFTTTSPPPTEKPRAIDQLMSQHQKTQGYYPSTNSMFSGPTNPISYPSYPYGRGPPSAPLYGAPPEMLHAQRNSGSVSYPYQSSTPSGPSSQFRPNYPVLRQGVTPVPLPTPPVFSAIPATAPVIPTPSPSRPSSHHSSPSKETGSLKTVTLPKDCLPRFLAIAKVNTAMNRETCGLLLGKDKGNKYTVTTLLIPKQHSTSDTCTMDEEELVLQFTEERSLITLGWIHTHPSQSCFMSSVDLHTHSGFQRMLPESFAVVCAPKSRPNFGIFRLTDPPGLKTILDCKAKDAFHPHPDLPIYTDADRGHVQMREAPLEIVDLR